MIRKGKITRQNGQQIECSFEYIGVRQNGNSAYSLEEVFDITNNRELFTHEISQVEYDEAFDDMIEKYRLQKKEENDKLIKR